MNKNIIIISFCFLAMLFVVTTTPTGFVIHSNTCCTNENLCSSDELCDNINPDIESPIQIRSNAQYAIGALILLTSIGLIHRTVGPKERK